MYKREFRNIVSSIRLGLDYDVYKARAMALLNSKARIIFFIMMDLVVDALFCVLYVVEAQYLVNKDSTDYPNPDWLFVPRPRAIWIIAVAMSSWNLMSALIRFIFADNKTRFIFSFQTLLDAVTAIPFLLSGAFPSGQWLYVPYFLRSWSVISRLQRALSIGVDIGISDQPFDPVKAKLIALVAYFVAILYNGMAAFLYCETMFAPETETPHTVWDAFYFILITASTVGYGDITPKSYEGKLVVMIFIIVALSVVPGLIAGTIEALKSSRSGGGSYIQSRGANGAAKQYLVMIGDFQDAKRVADMLSGFFNKEFSDKDVRVVFLSRNKPSKDVKTLMDMPMYKNRTTMLVGNGLDEVDLKRCQARDAGAVFIIPDRVASDLESQDTMTTLLAWSLHLYAPDTRVFTYNLLPETEAFQWGMVEQSMCISDVRQLLLAYNCRHQGTATLILNLLYPSEPANVYNDGWQAQYGDGTGNEIYVSSVPEVFVGWTFAQVSWFVFQEFQSILIGVDIFLRPETSFAESGRDGPHFHDTSNAQRAKSSSKRRSEDYDSSRDCPSGQYHLTLNPGNSYRLGKFDQLIFIAQSPVDLVAINKFTVEQYDRMSKDEKGHLDESRADFAAAMNMYCRLRESRSGARAAAKLRAEARRNRKARQTGGALNRPQEDGCPTEIPSSENHHYQANNTKELFSSSAAGSASSHQTVSRKAQPAWNKALYDDDDDDDDEYIDDSTLQRTKSASTSQSAQTYEGSSHRGSKISFSRLQQRSPENRNKEKEVLIGALDREEALRPGQENIPLSEARFWTKPGGQGQANLREMFPSVTPVADSALGFSSNFDRNAAAAAAADTGSQKQKIQYTDGSAPRQGSVATVDPQPPILIQEPIPMAAVKKHKSSRSLEPPQYLDTNRIPDSGLHNHHSVLGSFQEATYIGQTSITRSETKDLPLCHLLVHPPENIKPLIRDDLSCLKDHIVVCTDVGENLYRFLATLRLAQISKEDLKTVVVLTPNPHEALTSDSIIIGEMNEHNSDDGGIGTEEWCGGGAWDAILSFPSVFWVAGNCRHQRDLVRAGILGASSIVVMSHSTKELDRDEFADSTAIMTHHIIYQTLQQRGLLGRQHITVEICKFSFYYSLEYWIQRFDMRDMVLTCHTACASDLVERSNIRFLNMRDLSMVRSYHGARRRGGGIGSGGYWMAPIFASGQVLVSSLVDNVLFQAYSKTHILDLVKLCCGVRFKQAIELDQILGIDSSNVCLMKVPPRFVVSTLRRASQN
ncbi:potassium channel, sub T, member 2 [Gamsiella multidivaricata]|nr:potassium channel, sub T, member 2 [Gamsiella multidivaricata]